MSVPTKNLSPMGCNVLRLVMSPGEKIEWRWKGYEHELQNN